MSRRARHRTKRKCMSTITVDTNFSSSSLPNSDSRDDSRDYRKTVGKIEVADTKMSMRDVNVSYGDKQAVFGVDLDIAKNEVIAMIGPSGCGKSTTLYSSLVMLNKV